MEYCALRNRKQPNHFSMISHIGRSAVLKEEYIEQVLVLLDDLPDKDVVRQMQNYIQHGSVSTYEHCLNVAAVSYALAKKLPLSVNFHTLVLGAFLHDFYLYDWHSKNHERLHGFYHPKKAKENAEQLLNQPEDVTRIIYTHMWPLTFRSVPTSTEGWIVCLSDKIAAILEIFAYILSYFK